MTTYLAVVFAAEDRAHQALRDLWHMDDAQLVTVHSATVLVGDDENDICCETADDTFFTLHPGEAVVVAEISDVSPQAVDAALRARGGSVLRRNCPAQTAVVIPDMSDGWSAPRHHPNPFYA